VRLLVVPGHNDSEVALRATGDYLAQRAPGIPVKVIGFRPHGVRAAARHIPAPTPEERTAYASWVAESVGAELVTVV
jgi:pyruvate-formate lyase-activating enzyme